MILGKGGLSFAIRTNYGNILYRMTDKQLYTALSTRFFFLVHLAVIARAILRPHREPASRVAWIMVIVVVPVAGFIAYLLLGETSVGRWRLARVRKVLARIPQVQQISGIDAPVLQPVIPEKFAHLFPLGQSVNGYHAVAGNRAELMADSNASIESMVADIDAAETHVHLAFYIWLTDNNVCRHRTHRAQLGDA